MRRLALPFALLGLLTLAACGGAASSPAASATAPASQPSASSPSDSAPSEPATGGVCAESAETATVEATIAGNAFGPDPVEAKVGDVIAWTNADQVPHSVVVGSNCRTGTLRNRDTGALTFSQAGTYDYVCGIHPNMTGTIEITD